MSPRLKCLSLVLRLQAPNILHVTWNLSTYLPTFYLPLYHLSRERVREKIVFSNHVKCLEEKEKIHYSEGLYLTANSSLFKAISGNVWDRSYIRNYWRGLFSILVIWEFPWIFLCGQLYSLQIVTVFSYFPILTSFIIFLVLLFWRWLSVQEKCCNSSYSCFVPLLEETCNFSLLIWYLMWRFLQKSFIRLRKFPATPFIC